MTRDVKQLDADLKTAEASIGSIMTELGSLPTSSPTILFRVNELEKLPPSLTRLETDVATLKQKFKLWRWMFIGAVIGLQALKIDMQLFKLDMTLVKEWKAKDVASGFKNATRYTKELFDKQAKAARIANETAEKDRKAADKALKEELDAKLKNIPQKVEDLQKAVEPNALRRKLDPFYFEKSHVDGLRKDIRHAQDTADKVNRDLDDLRNKLKRAGTASTPDRPRKKNNAKQDVTALRESVTSLSVALAGL
ncbi:hypothetical protein ACIBVL_18820 [Streptomyces sp. NPDC049687]|uniref:hypothetical protein n=1 Tax=Streptomyces sp. NPDC049687 TaxID=3365596 RepID=UPI003792FE5C